MRKFIFVSILFFAGSFAQAQFNPNFNNHFEDENGRGMDRGRGPGGGRGDSTVIRCESNNGNNNYCSAGGPVRDARLVRQISKSTCDEGRTWGFDRGGVWVTGGCRGDFEVQMAGGGGGRPGPGPGRPGDGRPGRPGRPGGSVSEDIQCNSESGRYASCQASYYIIDAFLARQNSKSPCIEGQSWGLNQGRIWVDQGCRGTFRVTYR